MRPTLRHLCFLGVAVVVGDGCDNKVKECNTLADVANETVSKLDGLEPQMKSEDPATIATGGKEFVAVAESASTQIAELKITTDGLQAHADAYKTMLDEIAGATTEMVAILETIAQATGEPAEQAQHTLEAAQAAVEAACETASGDCTQLSDAMTKTPQSPDAAALRTLASDLGKLALTEEPVKKARDAYVAALTGSVAILVQLKELEDKLEANTAKRTATVANEDQIVQALNTFCGATAE